MSFIYLNYKNYISDSIFSLRDVVAFRGIEQFDFLMRDQNDGLIDIDKLQTMFLTMYYDLGLT